MNKLTNVEASRIVGVLDEALEKVSLLACVPTGAAARDALPDAEGALRRVLEEQAKAEARYEAHGGEDASGAVRDATRTTCRVLKAHAAAQDALLAGPRSEEMATCADWLMDLKSVTLKRLSTTVEQEQSRKDYISNLKSRIDQAEGDEQMLEDELRHETAEKEANFKAKDDMIAKLEAELADLNRTTEEAAAQLKASTEAEEAAHRAAHEERKAEMEATIAKLESEIAEIAVSHTEAEGAIRKKKTKATLEVSNIIKKYDEEMKAKEEEISALRAIYDGELKRLRELEEHFALIDRDKNNEAEEQRILDEIKAKEQAAFEAKFGTAAAKIQATYKGYKYRKDNPKGKKGKKGKKGGKKGKKGKKK